MESGRLESGSSEPDSEGAREHALLIKVPTHGGRAQNMG